MKTTGTTYNRCASAIKAVSPVQKKQTTTSSLNEKMTLRELLTLIAPTAGVSLPTAKALRTSGNPIAVYAVPNFSISIYPSGFALAVSYKRTTVVRVNECGDYSYDTLHPELANCKKSVTPSHIGFEVFLDTAWPVRVMMTVEDQLERNNNGAAWSKICLHPDVAADVKEYNRSVHGESIEEMAIAKMAHEEMLERLTDKQREAYALYYDEGYTMEEIGGMLGISKDAVKDRLHGAVSKVRKYMAENQ